jgi:uncharacterized protein YndB with AHSA1/START domain
MINVDHQINAVRRTVGARVLEAGEAKVVTVSQTYDTTIDDLWDACTNPERIPRWFLPIAGDLTLGGRYQLEGNASGTIQMCDPPNGFDATWEYGGDVSWIEVRLARRASTVGTDQTEFQLTHIAHVDDRWDEFGPGAVGIGWDLTLMGLAMHMASSLPVDPNVVATWYPSADGQRFMTSSSESWCVANISAGADEDAARAAAARSTAAYCGGEDPA